MSKTKTKKERLQALISSLKSPEEYSFFIEYRPFDGWYAVADEARFIGDEGEYLGSCYSDAKRTLKQIFL